MDELDLEFIYNQLKDRYDLKLSSGLALDAGFSWDVKVLTGKSALGTFYLYDEVVHNILTYDTEEEMCVKHWHPGDTQEALQMVIEFMEGTIV